MPNTETQSHKGAENSRGQPGAPRTATRDHLNSITSNIVDAAIDVHRVLGGPGLLESIYEEALARELTLRGHSVERQKPLTIQYKGQPLGTALILDMLVDGCVIIECKATARYTDLFEAQLLTYLRATGMKVGLVINFGEKLVKDGIHRVVNGR